MALIRYPGSKEKLSRRIVDLFPEQMRFPLWSGEHRWEYREPFFGAGAIGFQVLRNIHPECRVWLNDIDPGMVALWQSVRQHHVELKNLIYQFTPSADAFYRFKQEDGDLSLSVPERGFRKLALHRMSYSGLGAKSGGPLGGRHQSSKTTSADCRWRPERMKADVDRLYNELRQFESLRITCKDFRELIDGAPRESFVYLDPPYYEKGPALYKHHMTQGDHERLAGLLRNARCHWLLSYDDHAEIRRLYDWAKFKPLTITYTSARCTSGKRPKNMEVAIHA